MTLIRVLIATVAGIEFSFLGFSAMSASLVRNNVATLAAFFRAVRTTSVGPMTPDA
jgi:hypothetical protein